MDRFAFSPVAITSTSVPPRSRGPSIAALITSPPPESLSKKAAQYTPRIFAWSRFLVPITFNPGGALAAVPSAFSGGVPALVDNLASAERCAEAEKCPATRLAYRSDWKDFSAWCDRSLPAQMSALPATSETVAAYIAHLAYTGRCASTISRRLAAIAYTHKLKGLEPPTALETVRAVNRGIRRHIGTKKGQKSPVTAVALAEMLNFVGADLGGLRDRALLLIGFAAALRRSELVALHVSDLEAHEDGLLLHIRSSKTDQEGAGETIAVPRGEQLRPVDALQAWLVAAAISEGPIFRAIEKGGRVNQKALSDKSIAEIVKRYAAAAGLDPKLFSGHSLRAGFVTSALEHGADLFKVMDVTRHRRIETLKTYDRRARSFQNHAGKDFL
jgi:site-specific recombinase XerD